MKATIIKYQTVEIELDDKWANRGLIWPEHRYYSELKEEVKRASGLYFADDGDDDLELMSTGIISSIYDFESGEVIYEN